MAPDIAYFIKSKYTLSLRPAAPRSSSCPLLLAMPRLQRIPPSPFSSGLDTAVLNHHLTSRLKFETTGLALVSITNA
jgi:hypothetical protein